MSMGGFNGGDPALTLAQLEADVHPGTLRDVLVDGFGGGCGGPGDAGASARTAWIEAHGTRVGSFGAAVLYDLSGAA